jgi:L-fucose isomerase-like protein
LKSCNINQADLEKVSSDRSSCRANVKTGVKQADEKREMQREKRKSAANSRGHSLSLLPQCYPPLTTLAAIAAGDAAPALAYSATTGAT